MPCFHLWFVEHYAEPTAWFEARTTFARCSIRRRHARWHGQACLWDVRRPLLDSRNDTGFSRMSDAGRSYVKLRVMAIVGAVT